jgi:hypothetical protein
MELTDTLAYYGTVSIMPIKCLMVEATGACIVKIFTAITNSDRKMFDIRGHWNPHYKDFYVHN